MTGANFLFNQYFSFQFDIVLKIFSYLDLISLFRVGQVSRFFYDVSTHPLLYSELNLKPYWHLASTELISTLAKRATLLKKLDMSWCGCTIQTVSPTEFKKYSHYSDLIPHHCDKSFVLFIPLQIYTATWRFINAFAFEFIEIFKFQLHWNPGNSLW